MTGVDPNTGPADGGTWVTISGTNLSGATEVDFGGVAAYFWVDSDTSITALSPTADAGDGRRDGHDDRRSYERSERRRSVHVRRSSDGLGRVDPNTGPVDGGTAVTITGTGLSGVFEVDFGGIPADFVVTDDTSITAIAPASDAGTVDVTVTSDAGTSAVADGDQFTYG